MRNDSLIPATRFADPTVDFAFKRIFGTEAYKQNTVTYSGPWSASNSSLK